MSSKSDNNLVTSKAVTQTDVVQLMDTSVTWMSDETNPNRDNDFRSKTKIIIDNIEGICDGSGVGGSCPELPTDGKPQPEKNGNANAKTWKVTKMVGSKYKGKYKVVDSLGINIAVEFKTTQTAQQYIDHFVCVQQGNVTPTPQPTPKPTTLKAIISVLPATIISIGQPFILDGAKSQGNIDKYEWNQTSGETTNILEPNARNTTVVLPQDIQEGPLGYQLTITGSDGKTDTTSITVTVSTFPPTPTPTPQPTGDKDPEGITKIYPDDTDTVKAAQAWYLSKNGPNDSRLSGKWDAKKVLPDNTIEITPTSGTNPASARIYIRTTNPNALDQNKQLVLGSNWAEMAKMKYMIGPEDFRNCETTAYYKILKSMGNDEFTMYWMGGAHPSDDVWPLQCLGCCNKAQLQMDDPNTPRAAKEYHHFGGSKGYAFSPKKGLFDLKTALGGTMVNKLIGQKLVMYVLENPDGTAKEVHIELYVDLQSKDLDKPDYNNQKWQLFCEWIDNGNNWATTPSNTDYIKQCKAIPNQMISWGGPYVALRLDVNIWRLYALSIRPISVQK
jgi:hypothetical protein